MRIYRYILGAIAVVAIMVGLGVIIYGVSRSNFVTSDIPYVLGLLFCIYIVLQYMFLIKFGFYNRTNAENYDKRITIGIPVGIILLLVGFIGFRYESHLGERKRAKAQAQERLLKSDNYYDFYNLFDYPQQVPRPLAIKFLKLDPQYPETDTVWTVSRHVFGDVVNGLVFKTRSNGGERITLVTTLGDGNIVDKMEIGHSIYAPSVQNICRYEIDNKHIIDVSYQEIKNLKRGQERAVEVKRETFLVNENTGEFQKITGYFDRD